MGVFASLGAQGGSTRTWRGNQSPRHGWQPMSHVGILKKGDTRETCRRSAHPLLLPFTSCRTLPLAGTKAEPRAVSSPGTEWRSRGSGAQATPGHCRGSSFPTWRKFLRTSCLLKAAKLPWAGQCLPRPRQHLAAGGTPSPEAQSTCHSPPWQNPCCSTGESQPPTPTCGQQEALMSSSPKELTCSGHREGSLPVPCPQSPDIAQEPVGSLQVHRGGETVEGPEWCCGF